MTARRYKRDKLGRFASKGGGKAAAIKKYKEAQAAFGKGKTGGKSHTQRMRELSAAGKELQKLGISPRSLSVF
mgnify:FL=1